MVMKPRSKGLITMVIQRHQRRKNGKIVHLPTRSDEDPNS